MNPKKVVILHDWLVGFRGGERMLEAICEIYPEAPIYTLFYKPGTTSPLIENRRIHTSFLNKIPGIYDSYRKYLPLFPLAVETLKIKEEADLVISCCHNLIKGVTKPKGAQHICYIYSPMRYMYDQFEIYFGRKTPLLYKIGAHLFRNYLTNFDLKSNQNVDHFIAISNFIKRRVETLYHRTASVVYPFVDLKDFENFDDLDSIAKENFFVMVTAFAPNKRVDLAIKVFNELKLPLKIIGSGQQEGYLKSLANPHVEFLGNLSRKEVIQCLAQAQALIFPGVDDFGIVPLEALAAGTPVVALSKGGVLETLNQDVADFFEEATEENLTKTLKRFDPNRFSKNKLYDKSQEFSKELFLKNFKNTLDHLIGL